MATKSIKEALAIAIGEVAGGGWWRAGNV